jgi:hypothetical protein
MYTHHLRSAQSRQAFWQHTVLESTRLAPPTVILHQLCKQIALRKKKENKQNPWFFLELSSFRDIYSLSLFFK